MERLTTTPFGSRPISAGLLATIELADRAGAVAPVDKWALLQDLTQAKTQYGITDRDLAVLSALLSFHPDRELEGAQIVVFPSNASLAERAHGMAESTLRRHLAALVRAGLLLRHDSPNGKRYALRDRAGQVMRAFGFDLAPLLAQSDEIAVAAEAAREAAISLKLDREKVVIRLRDLRKLWVYLEGEGADMPAHGLQTLSEAATALRRKLGMDDLAVLSARLERLEEVLVTRLNTSKTENMSGNDVNNERHYQNSKTKHSDHELIKEKDKVQFPHSSEGNDTMAKLPLPLVIKACAELCSYHPDEVESWRDFVDIAGRVRPMIGISESAWFEACDVMGQGAAAIAIGYMLERMDDIRSPGGYLRSLTERAGQGTFSASPLIMALLSTDQRKPEPVS